MIQIRKLGCFGGIAWELLLLALCPACSQINFSQMNSGNRPAVTSTSPPSRATRVFRNTAISVEVSFPEVGTGVDGKTLNATNIQLYRTRDKALVPGVINTSGGGDAIVYQPSELLAPSTNYTFRITEDVKDQSGASFLPFSGRFTTGTATSMATDSRVRFLKSQVYSGAPLTSLLISPDRKTLYSASLDGNLRRWTIDSSGNLTNLQTFKGLAGRAIIGIAFDPKNPNVLWVSHNNPVFPQPAADFTGKISKLILSSGFEARVEDYIIGLPRSAKDHMSNSLAFGRDGKLYMTQASNSNMGAPDDAWYLRSEQLLNAAVLQIDPTQTTGLPLNVQTESYGGKLGNYNPYTPNAPVKIYASGIRVGYDLVWASNGFLYVAANGGSEGGNTPASPANATPAIPAITYGPTQDDLLLKVTQGGYYGHPNPPRHQYVMNGGNPTSRVDPAEIVAQGEEVNGKVVRRGGYPVGVQPNTNYKGFVWNFGNGRSPNGMIQYKSNTFGGALKNKLLVAEYSGGDDIVALTPEPNGNISRGGATQVVSDLINPLDLAEDTRNGNLYITELAAKPTVKYKFLRIFNWIVGQRPPSPSGRIILLRVAK